MDSEQRVLQYILENFLLGQDSGIERHDSLLQTGVLDSTGVLELVSFLENTFGIEIAEEDLVPENLDSISNIVAFLDRKRSTSQALVNPGADSVPA